MGYALRRRCRIFLNVRGSACEDDDGHCKRLQSISTHGVEEYDGHEAAADTETETALPRRSSSNQQARGVKREQFSYLGGFINETAHIIPDIKRRVRLAWVCFDP